MHVRHAEKSRTSTCSFADRIAELVIARYHELFSEEIRDQVKQSVLAGIVARVEHRGQVTLHVVALGLGTKYIQWNLLQEMAAMGKWDASHVKDAHAEVIAKRNLQLYLLKEVELYYSGESLNFEHLQEGESVTGILEAVTGHPTVLRLKPGITFHLYTSSAPCGNACIRKWAKSKRETFLSEYSADTYPIIHHAKFFVTARKEGQVAVLVKRYSEEASHDREGRTYDVEDDSDVPPSCAPADSRHGCLMTCSDKLAKWNALGIQGSLLIRFLEGPIYLASVTIGRKFSRAHCERALCCRIADFHHRDFQLTHPTLLCASIVFDNSVIDTSASQGADFQFSGCLSWCAYSSPEVIDGATGLLQSSDADRIASISRTSLHGLVNILDTLLPYDRREEALRDYHEAKSVLLTDKRFLHGWVKYKSDNHLKTELLFSHRPVYKCI